MVLHAVALRGLRVASWLAIVPLAAVACAAHGSSDSTASAGDTSGDTSGEGGGNTGSTVFDSGGGPATNPAGGDDSGATSGGNTGGNTGGDGGTSDGGSTGGGQACTSASTCPGVGAPNCAVACAGTPGQCTFTCNGENYDVNADASDGCEIADSPLDDHTQAKSVSAGSYGCTDGDMSSWSATGVLPSDAHAHTPAIDGFDTSSGSAPDEIKIAATGGLCTDDYSFTLTVTGKQSECYRLTIITDKINAQCQTNVAGSCTVADGSTARYTDGSTVFLIVDKTCSTAFPDDATYAITGHL